MKRNQAKVLVSEPQRKSQRLEAIKTIDKKQPLTQLSLPDKLLLNIVSMLTDRDEDKAQHELHQLSAVCRRLRHCVATYIQQTNIHRSAVFDRNDHYKTTKKCTIHLYGVYVGDSAYSLKADRVRQLLKFNGATELRLRVRDANNDDVGWAYDDFIKLLSLLPAALPIRLLEIRFDNSWDTLPAFAASLTVLQLYSNSCYSATLLQSIGHCGNLQMLELRGDWNICAEEVATLVSAMDQLTKLTTLCMGGCFDKGMGRQLLNELQRVPANLCFDDLFETCNFGDVKPGGYPEVRRICCVGQTAIDVEFLSTDLLKVLIDSFPNCVLVVCNDYDNEWITRDRLDSVLGGWLLRECTKSRSPRKVKILLPTPTVEADLPKRMTYTTGSKASVIVDFRDRHVRDGVYFPSCMFDRRTGCSFSGQN